MKNKIIKKKSGDFEVVYEDSNTSYNIKFTYIYVG